MGSIQKSGDRRKKNPQPKRHPFAAPFSDKRRADAGCNERREPSAPPTPSALVSERPASNMKAPWKLPWYEQPLADHWTAEERLFLGNWRREIVHLYDTFVSTAKGKHKLLWRASFDLVRLARHLRGMAKTAEEKAAKEVAGATNAVEAVKR